MEVETSNFALCVRGEGNSKRMTKQTDQEQRRRDKHHLNVQNRNPTFANSALISILTRIENNGSSGSWVQVVANIMGTVD
mmetsp:Transcript_122760/g.352624  ORF Transcript_122760/g.352624 Transcript_122760/m.352624 type:complete len:80 (-) Transcript_122760:799-1038(-)